MSAVVVDGQDHSVVDIKITKSSYGLGDPFEVHVLINRKLFIVQLIPSPDNSKSVEGDFLTRLDKAQEEPEDPPTQWAIVKEIEECVLDVGQPKFQELAPMYDHEEPTPTLHNLLRPDTIRLQLVTIDGVLQIRLCEDNPEPFYEPKVRNFEIRRKDLPIYHPTNITVLSKLKSDRVLKVLADGRVRVCKIEQRFYPDLTREIQIMQDLSESGHDSLLRIPRLRGFVSSEDQSGLIGFLMDYIDTEPETKDMHSLKSRIDTIERSRRIKWASQAEEYVEELHNRGVYWGDAKADNLVIDTRDNVWLIDLGGSRTEGWVSKDLMNTKEGDLQGLRKIRNFLRL
ncbi:MAG: hypothetical protein M1835_008167 [Candelina submexicana]|nr:MAG: hypothetical protein M1835_008167 [Candelina submexicana]